MDTVTIQLVIAAGFHRIVRLMVYLEKWNICAKINKHVELIQQREFLVARHVYLDLMLICMFNICAIQVGSHLD